MKEDKAVYILYRKGRAFVVSKEEWERSWLYWYSKDSD